MSSLNGKSQRAYTAFTNNLGEISRKKITNNKKIKSLQKPEKKGYKKNPLHLRENKNQTHHTPSYPFQSDALHLYNVSSIIEARNDL